MASFPGSKVHRTSRRNLGRGQSVQRPAAVATPVATVAQVVITFNVPMVVYGNIDLSLGGATPPTLLTQTVLSPTAVLQVYSSTVVTHTWSITGLNVKARTFQGGGVAPASGTF